MNFPFRRHATHQHGFTLVELIAVMVIVGILAAAAAVRYFDRAVYDAAAFADQARALIRYGQKVAVAQNRPVFVRLDGTSVALCFASSGAGVCPAQQRVLAPSGSNSGASATLAACNGSASWACEGKLAAVSYAVDTAIGEFFFDALGRPVRAGLTAFAKTTITVKAGGSSSVLVVEADTGHVH
ncbi:MAG TPA: prepilin-type N-terminal cleavage/methylation domain-containing protein [Telluria sp.]|jgi:MSHA pilin protein MshC